MVTETKELHDELTRKGLKLADLCSLTGISYQRLWRCFRGNQGALNEEEIGKVRAAIQEAPDA